MMKTMKADKISTDEKIEKMRKAKCCYPVVGDAGEIEECGKKQFMSVSVPVIRQMESGQWDNVDGMAVGVPACDYHAFIFMSGMVGAVQQDEGFRFEGAFEQVHLIESVINSMVLSGKLDEMQEAVKKGKEEADKVSKSV